MDSFSKEYQYGFTFLEILIGVLLLGMVMFGFTRFFVYQTRHVDKNLTLTKTRQDIKDVVELITREGRMAGFNPQKKSTISFFVFKESAADINKIDTTTVTIHQDLNENGVLTDVDEIIRYSYNAQNKQILRSTNGANTLLLGNPVVLLQDVSSCSFLFLNDQDTRVTDKTNVTSITHLKIKITAQTRKTVGTKNDPKAGQKISITMTATIVPRNRFLPQDMVMRNSILPVNAY